MPSRATNTSTCGVPVNTHISSPKAVPAAQSSSNDNIHLDPKSKHPAYLILTQKLAVCLRYEITWENVKSRVPGVTTNNHKMLTFSTPGLLYTSLSFILKQMFHVNLYIMSKAQKEKMGVGGDSWAVRYTVYLKLKEAVDNETT